jgi:hypothetical protein
MHRTEGKKIFLPKFLGLAIHQEVPNLFLQQERRGLVAKALAYQTS